MKVFFVSAGFLLSYGCATPSDAESARTYEFRNGSWFDGEKFVERTAWSEWGRLRFSKPKAVDEIIDLANGYVIPPLCEAHNHNLGFDYQLDETVADYLQHGVFYVKIHNNSFRDLGEVAHLYFKPNSVDIAFSSGALTGSGGHPLKHLEQGIQYGSYPGETLESLNGHVYWVVDDEEDLDRQWKDILSYRPDHIKIMLVYSEEYSKRKDDPEYYGLKGLNPELAPVVVEKAHAHGLRVSAHVSSAYDFHIAVAADVDEVAHLPGTTSPQQVSIDDANLAAEKEITVVTTTALAKRKESEQELFQSIQSAQIANLKALQGSGVTLAIGTDNSRTSLHTEANYLHYFGIFSNTELLNMWTANCAQTTFPDRHIGRLADHYEASFIVLSTNPLDDFTAMGRIEYRFKDGQPLEDEL